MTGIILHLGLGAFHRAHQADFTQDANEASGENWTIEAVSMRSAALARELNRQGGHFNLLIRDPAGPQAKRITCMGKAWSLPDEPDAIIARMADAAVSVVTITVTEKGYCAAPTGEVDWDHEVVAHDLANPDSPKGLLGLLCAGLSARRHAGAGALTILSCDNLPANGTVTRKLVMDFSQRRDPALATWIEDNCTFPSSMVDRITPASTEVTFDDVRILTGETDALAVETEPFSQWVIEDDFAADRPAWQKAGVLFVADVRPFEHMKLRILNGPHSLIAYTGALLGLEAVRDVMSDPLLARLVRWHMDCAANSLAPIKDFSFAAYADDLISRFRNPAIVHKCMQISNDGSQKMPQRIFSAAIDLLDRGADIGSCALATAVWIRFLEGTDEAGRAINIQDPLRDRLNSVAENAKSDDAALARDMPRLLGVNAAMLWSKPEWAGAVTSHLHAIRSHGLRQAILRALENAG